MIQSMSPPIVGCRLKRLLERQLAWWRYSQVNGSRPLVGLVTSETEHPIAISRRGENRAKAKE